MAPQKKQSKRAGVDAVLVALACAQAVCAQVTPGQPQVPVDPLTIGRAAFEDGFYDTALRTFTQAVQLATTPAQRLEDSLWQARADGQGLVSLVFESF